MNGGERMCLGESKLGGKVVRRSGKNAAEGNEHTENRTATGAYSTRQKKGKL